MNELMERGAKSVVLSLLCSLAVFYGVSCCDRSWIRFGDQCYKIFDKSYSRFPARFKCHIEGSDLVSISNVSVLDFLTQHLSHSKFNKFWVGLILRPDRQFLWFDATKADQPWVEMQEHQAVRPLGNIDDGFSSLGQYCFAFDGTVVKFNRCSEKMGLICSRKFKERSNPLPCYPWNLNSFVGESTGNCVFRPDYKTTKDKAEKMCNDQGAYFVDVDDLFKDGLTALYNHNILVESGAKYWTGLTWNGTYLFWRAGHQVSLEKPIPVVEGNGSCITLRFNFTDEQKEVEFHQTECDEFAYVVCSLPPNGTTTTSQGITVTAASSPPSTTTADPHDVLLMDGPGLSCPEGYNWKADRANRYCYWETSFETSQLTWSDAESYCKAFGGHLSSFHSVEEEKIGLSFQYGSLAHPYWIGLRLDIETETYKWTDGTPLDYQNWAPGHPNHKDKLLQCVSMDAQAKHWISSLCGTLSWFICKVPTRSIQPVPVLPTPTPLEPCDGSVSLTTTSNPSRGGPFAVPTGSPNFPSYFQGACYFAIGEAVSWHRAKQYCENEGASLVSIHSAEEVEFLLRLLHNAVIDSSRVWIGLNSFSTQGSLGWTDWTAVDFTFFSENQPKSGRNLLLEKCCNMFTKNGEWNYENCNAVFSFICKRINDTSSTAVAPSTLDPLIGNCKKGWLAHNDRCYYLSGKRKRDRVNWTEAVDICQKHGGYLTSIRNENDQNFLSYVLQILGEDVWIGLHDTIQSGRYYWLDNSEVHYTNWAPGEPSFFGITEDCVKMVYDHLDSGVWKDDECSREMGYVCQTNKNPVLPPVPYERGVTCLHPEGWLKLESMCFKMFDGTFLTWENAEKACQTEGGHLVSISDQRVKAVVSYLASEVNQPFFIGLKYKKDSQRVSWINGYPVNISNWEKNEPSFLSEDSCFASTSEGYWNSVNCEVEMPFVCQTTTGNPPKVKQYTGTCPSSSLKWIPSSGSYCYILDDQERYDWFTANLMCFRYGSFLTSIHSMNEVEELRKLMKPGIRSVYIGLMRNKKGGFTWMDDSPVDFTNWDDMEPSNSDDQCAEMMSDTLKWRVSPCVGKKHFICQDTKDTLVYEDPQKEKFVVDEQSGLSTAAICSIAIGVLVACAILVAAALLFRGRFSSGPQFRRQFRDQSVSFENAIYNVGNASMEFHDDDARNSL